MFKSFALLAIVALSASAFAPSAHAIPDAAKSIRVEALTGVTVGDIGAGAGPIKSSAWRTMVQSATRALKGVYIFNSSNAFLKVAIGVSGSEQVQLIVPPGSVGASGTAAAGAGFFYPLAISQGTKIAVMAADSDASAGYVTLSEYFY